MGGAEPYDFPPLWGIYVLDNGFHTVPSQMRSHLIIRRKKWSCLFFEELIENVGKHVMLSHSLVGIL